LQQELNQLINEYNRLKKLINLDEIKQLKLKLTKTLEECEQLKLINQKLQQQTSSPQQVNYFILIKQNKKTKKKTLNDSGFIDMNENKI